ncbi:hypothetical protein AB0B57_22290 [Micromonospora sp. NPDC049101]|uniref:hypothetical protein n=1 Tax=Micromonospora sp. NPDC049101 TaxID=3155032 RepID=UPI0033CF007B
MVTWTIAYRKPRANHFKRAANFAGTWHQAREVAAMFMEANPDLQVYYVTTASTEQDEAARIAAGTLGAEYADDHGNVMLDNGKRIKVRETGQLSPELLARVPGPVGAKARYERDAY